MFTIRVVDTAPQTIGSISPLNVTVENSLFYQINVSDVFTDKDIIRILPVPTTDAQLNSRLISYMTFKAILSSGDILPKWLRFYPNNLTFVGVPMKEEILKINLTSYD